MPNCSASENPKAALRKAALAQRAGLPMAAISRDICRILPECPEFQSAEHVLFYFPFRGEPDLLPLARDFDKKHWYLPVVAPGGSMAFHPYHPDTPLIPGKYGIAEPLPQGKPFLPDGVSTLIVVPGVLFDRAGYRLGYGKGYYDRFFSQPELHAAHCTRIGIVPEALRVDALPRDAWDIPMHAVVTEAGRHAAGGL